MREQLKDFGQVKTNEPLARHTTFKIGGPADFFVAINNKEKLVSLLRFLDSEGIQYFILGGGSNMLVSDEGYRGVAVKVQTSDLRIENSEVIANAGCATVEVARRSVQAGLTGFEWGVGLPGTIGGAVRGNAGAMGFSMKDFAREVDVYRNGEIFTLINSECRFHYRDSVFKHNHDVVLSVTLTLTQAENKDGMKKALEYLRYRSQTQPQGFASTGCIFKNIETARLSSDIKDRIMELCQDDEKMQKFFAIGKISAGWLIEHVGLKSAKVGSAAVSESHCNFIINMGGATAADVLTLVERIKEKVYNKFGLNLEEEIQII